MLLWISIILQAGILLLLYVIATKIKLRFADFDRKFEKLEILAKKNINIQERNISFIENKATEIQNTAGIYLLDFKFPVFFGEWAIDSNLGKFLIDYIIEHKPQNILEIGSGTSTVLISKLMSKLEYTHNHLVVDHEEKYLRKTSEILTLNSINTHTKLLWLPLERKTILGEEYLYYRNLEEEIGDICLDFVIIDGPPESTGNLARFPALPLLHEKLSKNAVLILDDYCREQEKAIVSKWLSLYPDFSLEIIEKGHQCAILRKKGSS